MDSNRSFTYGFSCLFCTRSGDKNKKEPGFRLFVLLSFFIHQIMMSAPEKSKPNKTSEPYHTIFLTSADGSYQISINQIITDANPIHNLCNNQHQNVIRVSQSNNGSAGGFQNFHIGNLTVTGPIDMVYSVNEASNDKENMVFISTRAPGCSFSFVLPNGNGSSEKKKQPEESESDNDSNQCDNCHNCYNCNECDDCNNSDNCNGCDKCNNCNDCKDCDECNNCNDCDNCDNSKNCDGCKNCDDCNNCNNCDDCDDYNNCDNCITSNGCENCSNCKNSFGCKNCTNCDNCDK